MSVYFVPYYLIRFSAQVSFSKRLLLQLLTLRKTKENFQPVYKTEQIFFCNIVPIVHTDTVFI